MSCHTGRADPVPLKTAGKRNSSLWIGEGRFDPLEFWQVQRLIPASHGGLVCALAAGALAEAAWPFGVNGKE